MVDWMEDLLAGARGVAAVGAWPIIHVKLEGNVYHINATIIEDIQE